MKKKQAQNIVIYKDTHGNVELRADVVKETIWATQAQIAELFGINRTVVTKHIKNIFKDKELHQKSVCANFAHTAADKKTYQVQFYSLDIILAVGYRTNSTRAIAFRQWATKTLRDYILKGYVLNAKRLKESQEAGVKELERTLGFIQEAIKRRQLDQTEIDGLLSVINGYANSWLLLQKYDEGRLELQKGKGREKKRFEYSFEKRFEYSFVRPFFSDGNKRIGSFLFVLFLELNGILYRTKDERKISDNALVALALLVAESKPAEKENIVALITNLIK